MEGALVLGVVALGVVHGVLPDHGWPIAAAYALDRPRRWVNGTVAALVLGVGHLVSSIALVVAYFWFATFAAFAEGPWMQPIAGGLLILLGVHEYRSRGHGHGIGDDDADRTSGDHPRGDDGRVRGHGHLHEADDVDHPDEHHHAPNVGIHHDRHDHHDHNWPHAHHDHHDPHDHHGHHDSVDDGSRGFGSEQSDSGVISRVRGLLPGGGHQHLEERHAEEGLRTLGVTALVLGFAHEEPVQILAICAGTAFCLELMLVYSLAVIVAILVPTLLLIAGYQTHRERIERYTPYLPTFTAIVLVAVGLAFVFGVF